MSLLQVEGLNKSYDPETKVLKNIYFEVDEGEFISIIGPSGAGKSTLLRCINRVVEINEGRFYYDISDVGNLAERELRKLRTNLGMIVQLYILVPQRTVIESVLY